jgi:hypothetical protein
MGRRRMPATKPMGLGEGEMTRAAYDIIITGSVRNDKRLGLHEQVLYGELRGLCKLKGGCYASNNWLAERLRSTERSVINWINKLEKCGHIRIERTQENKNIRHIYIVEGVNRRSYPMNADSPPMNAGSQGMNGDTLKGMNGRSLASAGIRKNTNKTTTTEGVGGDDLKNIPKKIAGRFSTPSSLVKFAAACGGDQGLMQRYLDYADAQHVRNPVGLAVTMAKESGREGPPDAGKDKRCAYCDDKGEKCFTHQGEKVWMCYDHRKQYQKLIDSGQKEKAARVLDKGIGLIFNSQESEKGVSNAAV